MRKFEHNDGLIDHNPIVKDLDIKALNKAENGLLEVRNLCPNGSSISGFLQNLSYFVRYYRTMCAEGSGSGDYKTAKLMAEQALDKLRDYLHDNLIKSVTMKEKRSMLVRKGNKVCRKEMHENGWQWIADPEDWEIVNTAKNGGSTHYGVKLWCGSGYVLDLFSVWADDEDDALCTVAEWCAKHQPRDVVTRERVDEEMKRNIVEEVRKDPSKFDFDDVDDMSDNDIMLALKKRKDFWDIYDDVWEDNYMYEWVTPLDGNADLYVRSENLFIQEWPDDCPAPEEV